MYEPGQRVRLVHMGDDPDPIPVGTEGTVESCTDAGYGFWQVGIKWDNGRGLMACCPPDVLEVVA